MPKMEREDLSIIHYTAAYDANARKSGREALVPVYLKIVKGSRA